MNDAGAALESSKVKDALRDGPDATLDDWSLRPGSSDVWEAFATVDEAMRRSPAELLKWVGAARAHDPISHRNIVAALNAKNPTFTASFTCNDTHDTVGRDTVHVKASSGGDHYKAETVKLKEGESHQLSFTLAELFGSAEAIGPATQVMVEIAHVDSGKDATASFRMTGSTELKVGSGTYVAAVTV